MTGGVWVWASALSDDELETLLTGRRFVMSGAQIRRSVADTSTAARRVKR